MWWWQTLVWWKPRVRVGNWQFLGNKLGKVHWALLRRIWNGPSGPEPPMWYTSLGFRLPRFKQRVTNIHRIRGPRTLEIICKVWRICSGMCVCVCVHFLWRGSIAFSKGMNDWAPPVRRWSTMQYLQQETNRIRSAKLNPGSTVEGEPDVKIWKIVLIITTIYWVFTLWCQSGRCLSPILFHLQVTHLTEKETETWILKLAQGCLAANGSSTVDWLPGHMTLKPTLNHDPLCLSCKALAPFLLYFISYFSVILSSKVTHFRAENCMTRHTFRRRKGEGPWWLFIVLVPQRIDYLLR